ncbi:hypothetical protein M433DRAFT_155355 [Acidomyces richmondensis BFW]|nr:MAG: hypothetical protein FE78DRAFT_92086 [Acidomyces sp. 'richmondensis']KYG44687.1 hypothetical protein M433DRAFT_155355 [Acidomyces richmondensis BFW]
MATEPRKTPEPKLISLGFLRTGTGSMAAAYEKLGYTNVYHGISATIRDWDHCPVEQACERTFPNTRPWYKTPGDPLTAEEWDAIFGEFDAITDIACLYWKQLLETYPDAKFVLVERPVDKWYKSFDETIIELMFNRTMQLYTNTAALILGDRMAITWIKSVNGYFDAFTKTDLQSKARSVYNQHYREIRATIPKEQLLDYKMGSGWEPLCKFLGKDIPSEKFPWVNDTEAMRSAVLARQMRDFKKAGRKMMMGILFCGMGLAALWIACAKFDLEIVKFWSMLQRVFLKPE